MGVTESSESSSATQPTGPVPLIVAVTGHRNIAADAEVVVEQAVVAALKELRESAPNTPMIVLSQLAEGADRVVARVALSMGLQLIAPLPMEVAEYERDFSGDQSRREFRELLGRAQRWFLVEGAKDLPPGTAGAARDLQYARAGAISIRYSHVLLALWDGKAPKLTGGTSEVVQYKLQGIPQDLSDGDNPLDPPEVGPVYHIVTPRADGSAPLGEPGALVRRFPSGEAQSSAAAAAFAGKLAHIDRFNADAATWRALNGLAPAPGDLPAGSIEQLPVQVRESLAAIRAVSDPADALASSFERRSRFAMRLLFVIALPGSLCFQAGSQPAPVGTICVALFLLFLAVGYAVLNWMKAPDVQTRHLDYRGLAEGLRVQFFWTLAGVRDVASRHYLRRHEDELGWIRLAMQSCEIHFHQGESGACQSGPAVAEEPAKGSIASAPAPGCDRLRIVNDEWIAGQLRWLTRRIHERQVQLLRTGRISFWLLVTGVIFAVIPPVARLWVGPQASGNPPHGLSADRWLIVAMIVVPIIPLLLALMQLTLKSRKMAGAPLDGAGHDGAVKRSTHVRHGRWSRVAPFFLPLGAAAISGVLIGVWPGEKRALPLLTLLAVALMLGAVFLHAYIEKRGLSDHIKQYSRMAGLLAVARRGIEAALDRGAPGHAVRIINALGRESLEQNESWLLLHRERPIDVPR